jgi:hypothetical protein
MSRLMKLAATGLAVCALCAPAARAQIGGAGWKSKSLQFHVQSPTNVPQSARYFVTNAPSATYHCLVYSNDGAFSVGNTTLPRTEQRFDPDYTNGEIQYQAMIMAPSNENSYAVFQIHTGDAQSGAFGSTTFMAFWFTNNGGSIHDYSGTTLATNLGNKWFQLNVDHNLVTRTILVWVNKKLVWWQQDNGAGDFYMKDGVYEQSHNPTLQMDTYITNILFWTSPGTNLPVFNSTRVVGGTNLVFSGSVGVAGATNYLLSTTNLALPVSQWTTISTNLFDDAGAFTITNRNGATGPKRFYLLKSN